MSTFFANLSSWASDQHKLGIERRELAYPPKKQTTLPPPEVGVGMDLLQVSLSINKQTGGKKKKKRERGRRARLVDYAFRKRGSAFTCSILMGSYANMKEILTGLVLGTRSSQVLLSFPVLLLLPSRLFIDEERDLEQVQRWKESLHFPRNASSLFYI